MGAEFDLPLVNSRTATGAFTAEHDGLKGSPAGRAAVTPNQMAADTGSLHLRRDRQIVQAWVGTNSKKRTGL